MLKNILLGYKKIVLFYLGNGIVQILASSLSVIYFQKLIDTIPVSKSANVLLSIFVAYGAFLVLDCLLSYIEEYPYRILSGGIYQKLKLQALEKVSRIDYTSYQDIGTGQLVKLVENGADAGRRILFDFYLNIFRNLLPGAVISLVFIGAYDLRVMTTIAAGYVLVFIITNLLLKYLYKVKNSILTHEEWLSKYSVRSFMELVVFRINKRFKTEIDKINDRAGCVVEAQAKIRMLHELFFALFALIVIAIKLVIIFTGVSRVAKGEITVGTIIALISFTDRVYTPIAIFNVLFVDYKLDKIAYGRFLDFINLPDDRNLNDGEEVRLSCGSIEFSDVGFSYGDTVILDGMSMHIPGGSSAAIAGSSGAGKSTVLKILLGLLKATNGKVLVDGQDLQQVRLDTYYDHVSYVSQDAPVFDGTLRENIIFDECVPDEDIFTILELVQLKEFVANLPQGLDTEVGEKGIKLSGGEKQRLAFARVFFQKSRIIILDEPTSALDSITEEAVTSNMLKILKDKTVVIIAHRLQTIKNVDRIFILEDGRLAESGAFGELLQKDGLFKKLWEQQSYLQSE